MNAPEPTPLEAAGFAWWKYHMHVGTWADESPQNRAYYAQQAAKIVAPALAGDWLERVLWNHDVSQKPWDAADATERAVYRSMAAAIRAYAMGAGL